MTTPAFKYIGGIFTDDNVPGSVTTITIDDPSRGITTQAPGWTAINMLKTFLLGVGSTAPDENDKVWNVPSFECFFGRESRRFGTFDTRILAPRGGVEAAATNASSTAFEKMDGFESEKNHGAAATANPANSRWKDVDLQIRNTAGPVGTKSFLSLIFNVLAREVWQHGYATPLSRYQTAGSAFHSGPTATGVSFYVQFLNLQEAEGFDITYWFLNEALAKLVLHPDLKDDPKVFDADVFLVDERGVRSNQPFLKILMTGPPQQAGLPDSWKGVALTEVPWANIDNHTTMLVSADSGAANTVASTLPLSNA